MKRTVIWIFSAVVVVILFMVLCTFVRRPYETVLLERFGNLIDDEHQVRLVYNWYLKMPMDNVVRIDNRLHLWPGPLQQVDTKGSLPITVRTYAAWRISDPKAFFRTFAGSDDKAMKIMGDALVARVGNKFGTHSLDEIFNTDETKVHMAEIEGEISKEVSATLAEQGLEVVQVGFSRMAFPPAMAQSVFGRMVAERNTLAQQYRSEGEKSRITIEGEGKQNAAATRATAQAESERIKGAADGEAVAILAMVQNSPAARDFYQYWKSVEFAKSALTKNTYLVLSTDNPILRALFGSPTTTPGGAGGATVPNVTDIVQPSQGAK